MSNKLIRSYSRRKLICQCFQRSKKERFWGKFKLF